MPRRYLTFVLLFLVLSVVIFLLVEQLGFRVEPYWITLPTLCILPAMLVIRRFPASLIPPVIFIGNFKTRPAASSLDLRDPTLWALCLLLATMLVHALLAFAGIDQRSLRDRVRAQREGIITYLFFVGVVAFSYAYSLAPEYGFSELTHFLVIGSALYFSSLFLVRSENDIRHFTTSALLLSVILTAQRFVDVMHYSETALPGEGAVEDLTRIGAGGLLGMTMLLLLLTPTSMRVRVPRQLLLLCIPWLAAGLTLSVARGPLLSFFLIVVISLFASKRDTGLLPRKLIAVGLVLLLIPTFLVSLSWLQNFAPGKVEGKKEELAKLLEFSNPGGSAGGRLELYSKALEGFAEKPFMGWGLGSFSVYETGVDTREYPHNLVLQIAMEQGLAGLVALAVFSVALVGALKKTVAATQGEWVFLVWIVLYLISTSMFSGDLDDQRPLVLWCGMAFASWRILKLRSEERRALWAHCQGRSAHAAASF
jgi:O-antigen ligase